MGDDDDAEAVESAGYTMLISSSPTKGSTLVYRHTEDRCQVFDRVRQADSNGLGLGSLQMVSEDVDLLGDLIQGMLYSLPTKDRIDLAWWPRWLSVFSEGSTHRSSPDITQVTSPTTSPFRSTSILDIQSRAKRETVGSLQTPICGSFARLTDGEGSGLASQ